MKSFWAILCILTSAAAMAEPMERQVTFKGAGGTSIAGTLLLPADAKGPVPALMLLSGSGPTDRNGNQPPGLIADVHKQIAESLAQHGIATLRFDKRGMYANRAEFPKKPADLGDFFCWENFVGDAVAGYRFLLEQPGIDASRTGVLGHSEGGIIALRIADALHDEKAVPRVLVLLGTPGRTIDALMYEQLQRILKLQGASPIQTGFFLNAHQRIWDSVRDTGKVPADVPPGMAPIYPAYLGRFLHEEMQSDPSKLAAKFAGPVLVINGAEDVQVSPEHDAKVLDKALSGRRGDDHALLIVPHASHNLKVLKDANDPGYGGPIVPEAMSKIETWVAEKLAGRSAAKP